MSQPPHQPPQDGSSWNQQPGQYGPPPGQYGPPPGQYGQPAGQYGQPPGQYGPPPSGGSGNGKVIGIVAAVVVVVAAVVLVLVFTVFKKDDEDTRADGALAAAETLASQLSDAAASAGSDGGVAGSDGGGSAPEPGPLVDATIPPDGLGDDDALDALAQDCFDGDMQSCDDLFLQSELGSEYEAYGDTCAGRQPANTLTLCTVTFPDA